ncbi:MAG: hypothetical protein WCO69_01635 [Candidatus Omnitrophota bacterium]
MKKSFWLAVFFLFLCSVSNSYAQDKGPVAKAINGFSTWGVYAWDSRSYNTFKLYYNERSLPFGLTSWGYIAFSGDSDQPQDRYRLTAYLADVRLSKPLADGFQLESEYGSQTDKNDVGRFGLGYKFTVKDNFAWLRYFPSTLDGSGSKASFSWRTWLWGKHLYTSGFIHYYMPDDWGYSSRNVDKIVAEPLIGYMLTKNLGLTVEYRYNDFQKIARQKREGIAYGVIYKF